MQVIRRTSLGVLALCAVVVPLAGPADAPRAPRAHWRTVATGLDRTVVDVRGSGEGWRTRVIALRMAPEQFVFRLSARLAESTPAWSVTHVPSAAAVALNAGQFQGSLPWGWVVMGGREIRQPAHGPLSVAIAWDRGGHVHWLGPREIGRARASGDIVEAFQSYPTLIDGEGRVPRAIREAGLGVDVHHHDGRLALGMLEDGRLIVAITRFFGFGDVSPAIPLGLTLGEMADVMRGIGCVRAVALDGGVSAQLMLNASGRREIWRGWRHVPLGLVAEPRTASSAAREVLRPEGD